MLQIILNFDFCQWMMWTKSNPCPLQWKEMRMCNIHLSLGSLLSLKVVKEDCSNNCFPRVDNFKSHELVPEAGAWCFSWKCHLCAGEMSVPSAALRQEHTTGAGCSFMEQSSLQTPAAAKSSVLLEALWGTLLLQLQGSWNGRTCNSELHYLCPTQDDINQ